MDTTATLNERLNRLEQENRRMRAGAVVLLVGLASLFLIGQTSSQKRVVVGESFVLMGLQGKPRAELALTSDGRPGLRFYGADGRFLSILELDNAERPRLEFLDEGSRPGISLGYQADGTCRLTLRGKSTKSSISLQTGNGSWMEKEMPDGKWGIRADSPSLEIVDEDSRLSAVLGALSLHSPPPIIPTNASTSGTVGIPITTFTYSFGPSTLTLFDKAGRETVQLSGASSPGVVIKGGAKNEVVWKAP
jgi:hypothetical protein